MSSSYVLNTQLLNDDTRVNEKGKRNQWLFFKSFLPLYLKMRFSKVWTFIIFIALAAVDLSIHTFDKPDVLFEGGYNMILFDRNYLSSLNTGLYVNNKYYDSQVYIYPFNEVAKVINDSVSEHHYGYQNPPKYINDKQKFIDAVNNQSYGDIYYDIEKILDKQVVDFYYTNDWKLYDQKREVLKAFIMAFSEIQGIKLNYGYNPLPEIKILGYSVFTSITFCLAASLIFLLSFTEIINLQESKAFLLLKISGAREYTIWAVFIIPEVIYTVLYSLVVMIIIYPAKCFAKHSFFLMFMLILIPMLAVYFMMLAFIPLIRGSSYYKWFAILFVFAGLGFGVFGLFSELVFHVSEHLIYVLSFFFPYINLFSGFVSLQKLDALGSVLSIQTIGKGYVLPFSQVYLSSFISMLIYIFIFLFFELFLPRIAGSPPIGFRNIFSLGHWKKLFTPSSDIVCTNPDVPFVRVEGISKTYSSRSGKVHALIDNSFSIGQNEIIVLIGPNGCGKSTLLNSMTGTIECDSGSLYLYGNKVEYGFSEMQNCIGIAFQDNVLLDKLSVLEHLRFFGKIRGATDSELNIDIQNLSSSLDLNDILPLKASTLSGGQKRKLCIAIAFVGSPPCVILDEPTAGIDVTSRQTIWKSISKFKNTSCLVTSHSLEEAESVASRLFVMKGGKIIFQDTASKLRYDYHCGYRLSTIGTKVNMQGLIDLCNQFVQGSTLDDERNDTVLIPVSDSLSDLFEQIDQKKGELSIEDFTVTVEQLEHVILRIIADEE
jgi:ABC-type multidrug transport system ATPase subunit